MPRDASEGARGRPFVATVARTVGTGLAIVLLGLLLCEAGLWIAAAFASGRASDTVLAAKHRVLCVGDSHTFGGGVPREEAYPSHLQTLLDARAPGEYAVINTGIPGINTTQVRNRLPLLMNLYDPDVIVVWAGANNTWNVSEIGSERGNLWLQGLANRSRVYRMFRVFLHDRDIDRVAKFESERAMPEIVEKPERFRMRKQKYTIAHGGVSEKIVHLRGADRIAAQAAREHAEADYRAIHEIASAAGVGLIFIAYPLDFHEAWVSSNTAVRAVADEFGHPVVEASKSLERIPPEEVKWLWAAHPDGRLYGEVARDVLPLVVAAVGDDEAR